VAGECAVVPMLMTGLPCLSRLSSTAHAADAVHPVYA
jgi:hypothetical protein